MPVVWAWLFSRYLGVSGIERGESLRVTFLAIGLWMVLSVLFDAALYAIAIPTVAGREPDWTFFARESPWIWLGYVAVAPIGAFGWWLHERRRPVTR